MMDMVTRWAHVGRTDALQEDIDRLAAHLQKEYPSMGRTDALKEAQRLQDKYGMGITLGPIDEGQEC